MFISFFSLFGSFCINPYLPEWAEITHNTVVIGIEIFTEYFIERDFCLLYIKYYRGYGSLL